MATKPRLSRLSNGSSNEAASKAFNAEGTTEDRSRSSIVSSRWSLTKNGLVSAAARQVAELFASVRPKEGALTVLSTFRSLDHIDLPPTLEHVPLSGLSYADLAKQYLSALGQERCFLFNGLSRQALEIALLKRLLPHPRRKLVVVDMIVSPPSTWRERAGALIRSMLLPQVDLFISYAVDTRGIEELYGLASSRFLHVPFKVNDRDAIAKLEPTDGGYIFVGGQTRRDYATLQKAIEGLAIPVRIVARSQDTLFEHGSSLGKEGWPVQVQFVRDADTPEAFLREIAGARLVVLPILEKNITPSGISVCLMAMALRKCVVISSGPAADGLVDTGQAFVVPAGDPGALRDAIERVWKDARLREQIAKKGFAYAMSLGDEKRLHQDIFAAVLQLCGGAGRSSDSSKPRDLRPSA